MKWRGQADIVGHKIGDTRQKNFAAQEYEALNLFKKGIYVKKGSTVSQFAIDFWLLCAYIYSSRTSLIIYPIFFLTNFILI